MRTTALLMAALALSGCATTSVRVKTPTTEVAFKFPKDLKAEYVKLKAGEYEFTAYGIKTDATSVVRAKSDGVTSGIKATGEAVGEVAPLFLVP